MNEDQIKHMANRFLSWRLPEHFSPDAGISFKPTFNDHMDPPMRHNPTGTNLWGYDETKQMVRHMVEGLPTADIRAAKGELEVVMFQLDRILDEVPMVAKHQNTMHDAIQRCADAIKALGAEG